MKVEENIQLFNGDSWKKMFVTIAHNRIGEHLLNGRLPKL